MGRKIVFHSFRRGVGRTAIIADLSHLMASEGRRVAVLDANIQFPGLHAMFGLDNGAIEYTFNDFLMGKCDIEKAVYAVSPCMARKTPGEVFCIPAASRPGMIKSLARGEWDMKRLTSGLRQLDESLRLDALLIETRAGLKEETQTSMSISDVLVLLMRPDAQDYQGTALLLDTAEGADADRLILVVNETPEALDPDRVKADAKRVFGREVAAVLPHFEEIMTLGGACVFSEQHPEHAWTIQLKSLARRLLAVSESER